MDLSQNSVNEETSDSLSASQYDAQTCDEWTLLSDSDDTNDTSSEHTNQSNKENENLNVIEESDIVSNNETHDNCKDEENSVNMTANISDNDMPSSDIEGIDESSDDERSLVSLCSSSVMSQMSTLSFLKDQYIMKSHTISGDYLNDDLSESSSLNYKELSTEVELKRGVRAYVHTPNTHLNVKLNLLLVISVTAVIGLGIGNFIGWSKHWNHQKQLSLGQVMKLKQLQDELVVCMQNQDSQTVTDTSSLVSENAKVCYSNSDYWIEKFEKLFSENRGLHELLEKTQKHYHLKGNHDNILSDKECDNKSASDEFHNLKLGFLVKQMEHLQLLKVLEEVKFKEKQSENRAKVLEAENSELKMKLVEEEADDELIVESWGNRVAILESENQELRSRIEVDEEEDSVVLQKLNDRIEELQTENDELRTALNQLEAHVKMVGRIPPVIPNADNGYSYDKKANLPNSPSIKLDVLRQTINQMVMENDELKTTIARLRWSSSDVKETQDEMEMIEDEEKENSDDMLLMEEQLMNLRNMLLNEKVESRKWKEKYEQMSKNLPPMMATQNLDNKVILKEFEESMFSEWIWNLTELLRDGLITSSSAVGDRLKFIFEQISQRSSLIPDEIYSGINTTQSILYDLNERLQNKWQELQHIRTNFFNRNDKITNKMSKLLENTLQKLQEARNKLINTDEAFESKIKNFSNRIAKLIENLDNKWKSLIDKWSKRYSKYYNSDKANTNTNWMFERANARREQQKVNNDNTDTARQKANWIFKRAKDREIMRIVVDDSDDDDDDNDNESEYRNWYFKKDKKLESDNDNDYDSDDQQSNNADTNSNERTTTKESYTTNVYSKQR